MRFVSFIALATLVVAGCASSDVAVRTLDSAEWKVAQISGFTMFTTESTKLPTMNFDVEKMSVNGTTSCNNYSGSFTLDGSKLAFGPTATTRMACPDMKIEAAFEKAMAKVGSYKISGDLLRLFDSTGVELLKAQPATAE